MGAGINFDGSPSPVLQDRLDTAIELYNCGVAPKIIMTGDNTSSSYNEVMAMTNYAIAQGVSEDDIFAIMRVFQPMTVCTACVMCSE